MQNTQIALMVAGLAFLVISIMHLSRLILRVEVKINNFIMPLWLSILGVIGPLILSTWMFYSAR